MANIITPPPTKDLLQRGNIRTMKKDIASLREADSLQEKQKISNIKIVPEPAKESVKEPIKISPEKNSSLDNVIDDNWTAGQKTRQQEVKNVLQQSAKQEIKQDPSIDADIKLYASEIEKQQIFLLQSRKAELEKQMTGMGLEESASLQAKKAEVQKKLSAMPKEVEQGTEQDEDAQKKRWVVEGELVKLEDTIKSLDESNQQSQTAKNNIKKEIAGIDDSLKAMSNSILQREKAKEEQLQRLVDKKAQSPVQEVPKITAQPYLPEKEFLKELSLPAREKLAKSTEIEEKRRAKFMEDVERWASPPNASEENN